MSGKDLRMGCFGWTQGGFDGGADTPGRENAKGSFWAPLFSLVKPPVIAVPHTHVAT